MPQDGRRLHAAVRAVPGLVPRRLRTLTQSRLAEEAVVRQQGVQVPVPAVPALAAATSGDHLVPAGVSAEAAGAAARGRSAAVPDGEGHGLAGPRSTGSGHRRALLRPGQALGAQPAHGGARRPGEDREDHQRRAAEGRRQPRPAGTSLQILTFDRIRALRD